MKEFTVTLRGCGPNNYITDRVWGDPTTKTWFVYEIGEGRVYFDTMSYRNLDPYCQIEWSY
jgi:hypothetical protein